MSPIPARTVQVVFSQPTQSQESSEGPGGPVPVHSWNNLMVLSTDRRYCARIAASSSALSRGPVPCSLAGPAPGALLAAGWPTTCVVTASVVYFLRRPESPRARGRFTPGPRPLRRLGPRGSGAPVLGALVSDFGFRASPKGLWGEWFRISCFSTGACGGWLRSPSPKSLRSALEPRAPPSASRPCTSDPSGSGTGPGLARRR